MSSYFDAMQREVTTASCNSLLFEDFLRSVVAIEERLFQDVTAITGDREFPDDLRQRIMGVFATESVYQPGTLPMPEKARDFVLMMRYSLVIETIHELFHDLARRRIETRFGWLNDSPTQIAVLRDDHDTDSEETD